MAAVLVTTAAAAGLFGNFTEPQVSPDGRHASMTWTGPLHAGSPDTCLYQCDACATYCAKWKPNAIGCCTGEQCCCCAEDDAKSHCTVAQCIAISKGKCPTDECSAPTPPPPPATPVPAQVDGLAAINKLRAAAGKAKLAECTTQAKTQTIATYDAANGKHSYTKANGWDGVCAADFAGTVEQCESNGYNGGDDGATWDNAVAAMQQTCNDALLGDHACAAFGSCKGCTTSGSGKTRNFYVLSLC